MQHRRKDLSRKCHSTVARGPVPRERPVDHSMARACPSPYGEGGGRFSTQKPARYRSAGALGCHTRIRAGFPRDCPVARSMARDRPSPYAERGCSLTQKPSCSRSAGACPPRTLECADDGEGQVFPTPYDEGAFYRPIASRPGCLSYGDIARIETGRSLLPGKRHRSGYHETSLTTTS